MYFLIATAINNELRQDSYVYAKLVATFTVNDELVTENQTIKLLELANTLEEIANSGIQAFYTGSIANNLVDKVSYSTTDKNHLGLI